MRFFFFFNDTATTEIYTLSLHDALPICQISPNSPRIAAPAKKPAPFASFETFAVTSAFASSISSLTRSCVLEVTSPTMSPRFLSAFPGGFVPVPLVIVAPGDPLQDLRDHERPGESAERVD